MAQTSIPKEVIEELKMIRRDLDYIKKHMIDVDTILTIDEERRLEESLGEYKEGKQSNLSILKRIVYLQHQAYAVFHSGGHFDSVHLHPLF